MRIPGALVVEILTADPSIEGSAMRAGAEECIPLI
jgi:hypothetical protein